MTERQLTTEEAEARVAAITHEMWLLDSEKTRLQLQVAQATAKYAVGETMEWRHGNTIRKGVISSLGAGPYVGTRYFARTIRADGSEGAEVEVPGHRIFRKEPK